MEFTTAQIAAALDEAVILGDTGDRTYAGVSTDTRQNCLGLLFVALHGDNYDANRFLDRAVEAGAAGAVIGPTASDPPPGLQYFRVENTLEALQRLAAEARDRMPELEVAAVTGSNGKSTTKEMIAAVCRRRLRTHATPGNYNNHIGVPLTLLSLPEDAEVLVAELGANHQGEIRELARLVRPRVSVITTVAPAHLEGFGSLEGVLRAKLEIFDEVDPDGVCIYCGDNALLRSAMPGKYPSPVSFGLEQGNRVRGVNLKLDGQGRPSFDIQGGPHIRLAIPGRYNALNALAAVAAGRALDIPDKDIAETLCELRPLKMRGEVRRIGPWTVLDDSYNANPNSMREAIATLTGMEHDGRRVAVLGQMLELGPRAREMHLELAAEAAVSGLDLAVLVGEYAESMRDAWAAAGGDSGRAFAAKDADEAWEILRDELEDGDLVLVKASRGIRLERVVENMAAGEDG